MKQIQDLFPHAQELPEDWQRVNAAWLTDEQLPWPLRVQQIDCFLAREADPSSLHFLPFAPAQSHFLADWLRTAWLGGTPIAGRAYTVELLRERLAAGRSALIVEPLMIPTAPNSRRIWLIEPPAPQPAPAPQRDKRKGGNR
jgi:hypothetical protein